VPNYEDDPADAVFKALADPTRRSLIERLVSGPATTSELAQPFTMALPSLLQHLAVLERANLITSTKDGRTRTYRLSPAGLDHAQGWLADQRRRWESRLDRLDEFLTRTTPQPSEQPTEQPRTTTKDPT
jgi:DNA-binding transcriptional ArsR family regulator